MAQRLVAMARRCKCWQQLRAKQQWEVQGSAETLTDSCFHKVSFARLKRVPSLGLRR